MKTLKALLLLAVVLSVDHSVTADPIPDSNSLELLKRSFLEFFNIILCNMPNGNPTDYIDYGCYCGLGGSGTPVDDLDRCCQVHDECYGDFQKDPKCKDYDTYRSFYDFTCDEENKKATCSKETNNECENFLCECDRVAAECFANTPYNDDNWDIDHSLCE